MAFVQIVMQTKILFSVTSAHLLMALVQVVLEVSGLIQQLILALIQRVSKINASVALTLVL